MNSHAHSLLFVSALTLILVAGFAYLAPGAGLTSFAAQSASPSGSYGFLINSAVSRTSSDVGSAVAGVLNFDGAGNLTGSYTLELAAKNGQSAQTLSGGITGTYSTNPDGTGTATIALDLGLTFTFSTLLTDGGHTMQLVGTQCSCNIGGDVISGIARSAYTGPLKGSFGFHLDASPEPSTVIGVVSFDGSGNAAVSFTAVAAGHDPNQVTQAPVINGTLTGTYSTNADGTGMLTLTDPSGQAAGTFAFVMTDGGSGAFLLQTSTTGSNVQFGTARLQ